MYTCSTLENTNIETLHEAFLNAFSDYQVKINISLSAFQLMIQRRGYVPEISIGAFKKSDYKLVGFILNGLRDWEGKLTVYDTGTGVVPSYRKQGITGHMFKTILEVLEQKNVEQYLLEVIKGNTAALELYKKQGFQITRNFLCFKLDKEKYVKELPTYDVMHVKSFEPEEWEQLKTFWNFSPSWQNSIDSIKAVQDEFIYALVRIDDKIVGCGIAERKTGDIPQIAVDRDYRRKGIARSIISNLLETTESTKLSVLNVDEDYKEMKLFLSRLGFEEIVSQYEMILPLKR